MTTDAAREQIRQAVDRAVDNLKTLAERNPSATLQAGDFNRLLERAAATFPDMPALKDIGPVEGGTTMGELMFKLSMVQGGCTFVVH